MQSTSSRSPRRTRRAALAVLLLAGLALALPGQAKPRHDRGFGPGGFALKYGEEIGLDEATRADIEALLDAAREQGEALREEKRAAHEAMRALLDQDAPDADAVMQQAETIGAIDVREQQHRLQTLLAVRALLTPEQREALAERKEQRQKHGRHGRHGGCDRDQAAPETSAAL